MRPESGGWSCIVGGAAPAGLGSRSRLKGWEPAVPGPGPAQPSLSVEEGRSDRKSKTVAKARRESHRHATGGLPRGDTETAALPERSEDTGVGSPWACGVVERTLVEASPSAAQMAAIEEIISAIRWKQHGRVGVLMEQFVQDADMPALLALQAALHDTRPDTGRADRAPSAIARVHARVPKPSKEPQARPRKAAAGTRRRQRQAGCRAPVQARPVSGAGPGGHRRPAVSFPASGCIRRIGDRHSSDAQGTRGESTVTADATSAAGLSAEPHATTWLLSFRVECRQGESGCGEASVDDVAAVLDFAEGPPQDAHQVVRVGEGDVVLARAPGQ
ncbi:hypothetical protein QFZ75_001220 [Streptomyces sp. V3I8]|nr:hypothetical protein [Streptomyces sp. V3I8]